MKKSLYYLIAGTIVLLAGIIVNRVLKLSMPFSFLIQASLLLAGLVLLKRYKKVENIEHGKPANYTWPTTKKQKTITRMVQGGMLLVFIIIVLFNLFR